MSILDVLDNEEDKTRPKDYFPGVTVGVVTNINDPEKRGRLKVRIINRNSSNYETDFIRIMTPMTGKQWGSFFFPEVGDEVLVAFSNGDISRPYVLGALWNNDYKPPHEIKDEKNDIRMIKTRCGHEIVFNDEQDKESIQIKTKKELSITLDDEKEIITIKDKAGKNIMQIDSKNDQIEVTAAKKIILRSGKTNVILEAEKNKLQIESKQSISIKSQDIRINAKNSLELKAGNNLAVKSDGPASVKGATVKIN